jgi:peptide deformylase
MLKILKFPDPRLRIKAKELKFIDKEINLILGEMKELMYEADGIGLAATQVGIQLRIFTFDLSEEKNSPQVVINPRIISKSQEKIEFEEGCLSIPGLRLPIKRSRKIIVKWIDERGNEHQKELENLESVLFQHEIDHLDGKLIIDKLPPAERKEIINMLIKAAGSF